MFDNFKAGYFPNNRQISSTNFQQLEENDYMKLIEIYGYKSNNQAVNGIDIIKAFQMHFSMEDIYGTLS